MAGKFLLPVLGGSPGVWNTCMVFFQGVLLLGYLYAHVISTRLPLRGQVVTHAGLIVSAGAYLFYLNVSEGSILKALTAGEAVATNSDSPTLWLIGTLAMLVGPGFFVVSTTGPLLQKWFSATDDPRAKDPYFLYAASNAGSLLGLLSYPFVVEPWLTRRQQSVGWALGFAGLAVLVGVVGRLAAAHAAGRPAHAPADLKAAMPLTPGRRVRWAVLALVPSSLMLGVTQHIATDVASVPLLWVVPLALYLVSFIWAYSPRAAWKATTWGRLLPVAVLAVGFAMIANAQHPVLVIAGLHIAGYFVAAMMCHTLLAEDRPDPAHLTEYYLLMSVGGVLGGLLNAVVAPHLFNAIAEYPLMIVAACLLRPQAWSILHGKPGRTWWLEPGLGMAAGVVMYVGVVELDRALRGGMLAAFVSDDPGTIGRVKNAVGGGVPVLALALLMLRGGSVRFALGLGGALAGAMVILVGPGVLDKERTFFGVHVVQTDRNNTYRMLRHGTTLHGLQIRTDHELPNPNLYPDADFRYRLLFARGHEALPREERVRWLHLIPTTYYHPTGPIGDVMKECMDSGRFSNVALIGLGTGSLLAYARPNVTFHVFEIDPAVLRIARTPNYFRYALDSLRDPTVRIASMPRPGDGRVDIALAPEGAFDLIVIDAFSSDSIPVHLMTREAVEQYLRRLKPDGIIAFHVSSRHFTLPPVLARLADDLGLAARVRLDNVIASEDRREAKRESDWVILARTDAALGSLARNTTWERLVPDADAPRWTDDYANILRVMHVFGVPRE